LLSSTPFPMTFLYPRLYLNECMMVKRTHTDRKVVVAE
jgi:hypothetical protein